MWIRTDHCPTCDAPIDVYVPQPYASGPELLTMLESLMDWYGDGEDVGDDWEGTEKLMIACRALITSAADMSYIDNSKA